jgi:hypothetical protein
MGHFQFVPAGRNAREAISPVCLGDLVVRVVEDEHEGSHCAVKDTADLKRLPDAAGPLEGGR